MPSIAPSLSIVVPTYNERANLPPLLAALRQHAPRPYEVIVVDDASPDGTADAARSLAREHPVRLVARQGKLGLGSACRAGVGAARGDAIALMDADLSHDPCYLPALHAAVQRGAGLAIGSRYIPGGGVRGWGPWRRSVSWGANALAHRMLHLPARDATSGYRCLPRENAGLVLDTQCDGYAFQVEEVWLAMRRGLSVDEVPIVFLDRRRGKSKLGMRQIADFGTTLLRLRREGRAPRPGSPRAAH